MKTHRGPLLRGWLLCGLLSVGGAGCSLYFEMGDGSGGDGDAPPASPDLPGPPPAPPPAPPVPPAPLVEFGTTDGGNSTGLHTCAGSYAHYEHPSAGGTQLHVVGIYEPDPGGEGAVDVRVTRPGRSVLVLSSYERTTWNVTVAPGAFVERIILSGFYEQSAIAPEGTPIERYAADSGSGGFGYGHAWPSYGVRELVENAQASTGLTLTSFRGCQASESFLISAPVEIRPPHPVSDEAGLTLPAGCEHLASESVYCLSRDGGSLVVLGADSGIVCQNDAIASSTVPDTPSLGWRGDYAYGCVYGRGLARLSLVDGTVDIAPIACEAVTVHDDGSLLVMPFGADDVPEFSIFSVLRFDSFEAAARREIAEVFPFTPQATRMAVADGRGYFAWHSTDTIEVADLATGALQSLPLEGYDDWIFGLDVVGDRLLVLGPSSNPGLRTFDVATGKPESVLVFDYLGEGLACAAGAP